jgi:hypothetical protein
MALAYKPEELDVLVNEYRLTLEPSADRSLSLLAIDLLDGDKSRAYLEKVNGIFEATTRTAVASLFAKRYSCLTIASALYAMSVFDKGMDYAIENCRVSGTRCPSPCRYRRPYCGKIRPFMCSGFTRKSSEKAPGRTPPPAFGKITTICCTARRGSFSAKREIR